MYHGKSEKSQCKKSNLIFSLRIIRCRQKQNKKFFIWLRMYIIHVSMFSVGYHSCREYQTCLRTLFCLFCKISHDQALHLPTFEKLLSAKEFCNKGLHISSKKTKLRNAQKRSKRSRFFTEQLQYTCSHAFR
jgi:hypothetical protein